MRFLQIESHFSHSLNGAQKEWFVYVVKSEKVQTVVCSGLNLFKKYMHTNEMYVTFIQRGHKIKWKKDSFENLMVKLNSLESLVTVPVSPECRFFESLRKVLNCLIFQKVERIDATSCLALCLSHIQPKAFYIAFCQKPRGWWILFNSSWKLLELELSVGVLWKNCHVTAHAFGQQLIVKILEEVRVWDLDKFLVLCVSLCHLSAEVCQLPYTALRLMYCT